MATIPGLIQQVRSLSESELQELLYALGDQKHSSTSRQDPAFPMSADDLVRLDNAPDAEPVVEVLKERYGSMRYLTRLKGRAEPKLKLAEISDQNAWGFDLGDSLVLGQLGRDIEAHPRSDLTAAAGLELKPGRPNWSGVTYHPKLGAARTMRPLRRTSGQRVIPHYVFGDEDRRVYYPDTYPWRCVGKVYAWTNPDALFPSWSGAGALVGRNVVLTASHVVPWGANPWMMQFIPAYYDGSSLLGSGVFSYVESVRGYRDHDQGDDMAVLKLYNPLGDSLGYFGSKTYDDDWEDGNYWTKCGYPGAIASGNRPSRITWFPIIDDDNDGAGVELEYRADSSGGDSGGPVFGWWSGEPYVIGTHSGGEEEYQFPFSIVKNNVAAGGSALVSLISWAHGNW